MNNTEEKLIQLEKKLIEQEHRPTHILFNFFNRKKYPKNDERRKATKKALIWRLLFSPTVIATTSGGIIAFATLFFLFWQNSLLTDQNNLIQDQNQFFRRQILSDDIKEFKAILDKPNDNTDEDVIYAFKKYVEAIRQIDSTKKIRIANIKLIGNIDNDSISFKNIDFVNVDFRGSIFAKVDFSGSSFNLCSFESILKQEDLDFRLTEFEPALSTTEFFRQTVFFNCNFSDSFFHDNNTFSGSIFFKSNFSNSFFSIDRFSKNCLLAPFNYFIGSKNLSHSYLNHYANFEEFVGEALCYKSILRNRVDKLLVEVGNHPKLNEYLKVQKDNKKSEFDPQVPCKIDFDPDSFSIYEFDTFAKEDALEYHNAFLGNLYRAIENYKKSMLLIDSSIQSAEVLYQNKYDF